MRSQVRPAAVLLVLLTLITGLAYPAAVAIVAHVAFPGKVDGSLLDVQGRSVGSELIGQPFSGRQYFWPRPSATSPVPYAAGAGTGSNLGPSNPAFLDGVKQRVAALRAADPDNRLPVPVDLVTASASGLDPHVSAAAASYQAARVARERGLPVSEVQRLIREHTEERTLGVLGEPRVNVLKLNLALDAR